MPDLVCPFCKVRTNFTRVWESGSGGTSPYAFDRGWRHDRLGAYRCDNSNCRMTIGAASAGTEIVEYWPQTHGGKSFPDVPEHIASAADEAHQTLAINARRAAIAMARAVVEATAKDHGIIKGNLMSKIDELEKAGTISSAMKEAAHEIRFAGNEVAHGDLAEEAITAEEAEDVLALMDAILLRVYQEPAQVQRVRQRREAR